MILRIFLFPTGDRKIHNIYPEQMIMIPLTTLQVMKRRTN